VARHRRQAARTRPSKRSRRAEARLIQPSSIITKRRGEAEPGAEEKTQTDSGPRQAEAAERLPGRLIAALVIVGWPG
jgi:hypothetical protein